MNSQRITSALALVALSFSLVACDEKTSAEEAEDAAEAREELLENSREDAPKTAAEMRKDVGNIPDEEPDPETVPELRKEVGLYPEKRPKTD